MDTATARELLEEEKARLSALRGAASRLVEAAQEAEATELSQADQHPSDAGSELRERETMMATEGIVGEELAELQAAFERLDEGTYGVCERCGQPIAEERLQAKPSARRCVRCQAIVDSGRR